LEAPGWRKLLICRRLRSNQQAIAFNRHGRAIETGTVLQHGEQRPSANFRLSALFVEIGKLSPEFPQQATVD